MRPRSHLTKAEEEAASPPLASMDGITHHCIDLKQATAWTRRAESPPPPVLSPLAG